MTSVSSTSRRRKGRLLLVGSSNGQEDVADHLDPPAVRAGTLFDAIGEITTAPAHAPIGTVLISSSALPEQGENALQAIRRADPALGLYLIAERETPAHSIELVANLCDGVLQAPLAIDELQRLVDDEGDSADAAPPVESPTEAREVGDDTAAEPDAPAIGESSESSEPAPDVTAEAPPSPPEPPAEPVATAADELVAESAPTEPSPPPEPVERMPEPLGDVDLIEAAMRSPRGILDTALRLIREHTGWNDLRFEERLAGGAHGAEVVAHQQRFGYLVSGDADESALERWASWLARWLLLDHHYRTYRRMAYQDELTGAWNRRYFFKFLGDTIRKAAAVRRPVSVLVFDIDDFKRYNDAFGHEAGDVILIETVRLLKSEIRNCDRVCRIGGDEFAVIFADLEGPRELGSTHPETVEMIARRFQKQICEMKFPKLGIDAPGTLSISGGLASFPWDGADPMSLLNHADQLSMHSKRAGKNALTFGPGAQAVCPPDRPRDDSDSDAD